MTYSEKLKEIRVLKKMSLREFGRLIEYDPSYLSKLERGYDSHTGKQPEPTLAFLKRVCDRAGYDFRTFLEETGYLSSSASYDVTSEELSILEKLRSLSPAEKQTVLQVLEMSYEAHQKNAASVEKHA